MSDIPEYAELYSRQERQKLFLKLLLSGIFLCVAGFLWLVPELNAFVRTAHCQEIAGVQGIVALVYGMFVGVPLLMWLVLQLVFGWYAVRIIRDRQSPPRKVKVLWKTRITVGRDAVLKGVLLIVGLPAAFIMLISVGAMSANDFLQSIDVNQLDYSICVERHEDF